MGASALLTDLVAGRREDVPGRPELARILAVRVAGLRVTHVVVERVAVVRHLVLAVRARGRPDQGGLRSGAGPGRAARRERRPGDRAGAVAGALRPRVLLEEVEGAALRVHQDLAEARVPDVDGGGLRLRRRGGWSGAGLAASAAPRDRHRDQGDRQRRGQEGAAVVGHAGTLVPSGEGTMSGFT